MSAFRVASAIRAAPRAFALPRAVVARRGYADIADDRLKLSLVLPHSVRLAAGRPLRILGVYRCKEIGSRRTNIQSLYSSQGVTQVNIPAATGDMGILANHVPSVEALKAGVVEVIEDAGSQSKKWFSKL
jgi:F-type H+-transporting ATPase subunit delta